MKKAIITLVLLLQWAAGFASLCPAFIDAVKEQTGERYLDRELK